MHTQADIDELKDIVGKQQYKIQNLNKYKRLYQIFLNKIYSGCSCKAIRMYHELKKYMVDNKIN